MTTTMLDRWTLNRTLLDRQRFNSVRCGAPTDVIEHLIGLQAQSPTAPYIGLRSRIGDFSHHQLSELLLDRSVVRIVAMRNTVVTLSVRATPSRCARGFNPPCCVGSTTSGAASWTASNWTG